MLRERKQLQIPEAQLEQGLAGTSLPGEPVAIVNLDLESLAERVNAIPQHSFDNLDELDIAVVQLEPGLRAALVHHLGLPADETELLVDREVWKRADVLDHVLNGLGLEPGDLSWRQEWPVSALG